MIQESDIQDCHFLGEKKRTIFKFVNRKDTLCIPRKKNMIKLLDATVLDFPEGEKIFINKSLHPYYRGIWNNCKKLRGKQKLHWFFTINGLVCVKLEEPSPIKIITHIVDLVNLLLDINIDR